MGRGRPDPAGLHVGHLVGARGLRPGDRAESGKRHGGRVAFVGVGGRRARRGGVRSGPQAGGPRAPVVLRHHDGCDHVPRCESTDEAIRLSGTAVRLEPDSLLGTWVHGVANAAAGHWDEADEWLGRAVERSAALRSSWVSWRGAGRRPVVRTRRARFWPSCEDRSDDGVRVAVLPGVGGQRARSSRTRREAFSNRHSRNAPASSPSRAFRPIEDCWSNRSMQDLIEQIRGGAASEAIRHDRHAASPTTASPRPSAPAGWGRCGGRPTAKLGREVALKVLPEEFVGDTQRLDRFEREARAVAALNHPHIVTIYSVEEAEGTRFLTMELMDGEEPRQADPEGRARAQAVLRAGDAAGRGDLGRPRQERDPPRPQAVERDGRRRRPGQGARLRSRQAAGHRRRFRIRASCRPRP